MTAAIYCARAELRPGLVEGLQPGGQLTITTVIENFPGFPEGISGPDLMQRMREQAERFGTELISDMARSADLSKSPMEIKVGNRLLTCDALIIATGASARYLNLPREKEFHGKGISACATCDGFFYKDREVVIVGGGDTAMEEAMFLTRFATKVTVVHRRDELRASKYMQQLAFKNEKIEFAWSSVVKELLGDPHRTGITGVKVEDTKTGETREIDCEGVFYAIGHEPNTVIFRGQLPMNEAGYIKNEKGCASTRLQGVFVAGDVADPTYRQAVSAAGTGCMAALEVERYLAAKEMS
jgi:thioredoxin reductase (NADPH)